MNVVQYSGKLGKEGRFLYEFYGNVMGTDASFCCTASYRLWRL